MKESLSSFLRTDKGFVLLWVVLMNVLSIILNYISSSLYHNMTGDYYFTSTELLTYQITAGLGSSFIMAVAEERAIRFYTGKHVRNWITLISFVGFGLYFARVSFVDVVIKSDLIIDFTILQACVSTVIIFKSLAQWFLLSKEFEKAWLWLIAGLCSYGLALLPIAGLIPTTVGILCFALALVFMKRATEPEAKTKNEPIVEAND